MPVDVTDPRQRCAAAAFALGQQALLVLSIVLLSFACGDDDNSTRADDAVNANPADQALLEQRRRLQELDAAVLAEPQNAELYAQRGAYYIDNDLLDRAVEDLTRSVQLDSSRVEVWHLLADAQFDNLRSRDAINTMIYASSRFPERVPTLLKLAEMQLIVQRYDDAVATLDRAVAVDPGEGEVFFLLAEVLREQGGHDDEAINAYQRATELNPDIVDAWLGLGGMFEQRDEPIAERYFRTASEVDREDPQSLLLYADYLRRQGRLEEALQRYDAAVARDPQRVESIYASGFVALELERLNAAAERFNTAIQVEPTYAEAHHALGVVRRLQGDLNGARQAMQRALELSPDYQAAALDLADLERYADSLGTAGS